VSFLSIDHMMLIQFSPLSRIEVVPSLVKALYDDSLLVA